MKINWKVRLRNPVFWLTAIPAVLAMVYTVLGLFGIVPTISKDMILNAVVTIVEALTVLGVLVDPTTPGASDSDRAMKYSEPGKAEDDEEV
jgi:phi LC3 family holin